MESIVSTKIFKKLVLYCFLFVFLILFAHIIFYIQIKGVREALAERGQIATEQASKGQGGEKMAELKKTVTGLEKSFGMPLTAVLRKLQRSDATPQRQDVIDVIMQQAKNGGATVNIQTTDNPGIIRAVWQGNFAGFEAMLQALKGIQMPLAVQQMSVIPQKEGWSFEFEILIL